MGGGPETGERAAAARRKRKSADAGDNEPGEERERTACEGKGTSADVGGSIASLATQGTLSGGD